MFPVPVVRSVLMERATRTRLPQMSLGGHFGPEVDAACLAEEPAVDRWEVGVEYPSWEQTVALARFLDVRVRDLAHPDAEPGTTRSVSTTQDFGPGDPVLRACGRLSGHSRCRRHRAHRTRRSPRCLNRIPERTGDIRVDLARRHVPALH